MNAVSAVSATNARGVSDDATRIVVFNDLHLADNPPAGRKDGYREEGLAMLAECVDIANEENALLATTGDLYHIKRPDRVSHALNGEIVDILRKLKHGPLLVVPGNHDMGPLGLVSVNVSQPMRGLIQAGVVEILDGFPRINDAFLIASRPYNMARDTDPAYYALTEEEFALLEGRAAVMLAHGSIIPDHEERPYPTVYTSAINTDGITALFCGHIHEDLGHCAIKDGVFINRGALGRCSRTLANRTRTIMVAVAEAAGFRTRVLTSALPGEDIFIEDSLALPGNDAITEFVKELTEGVAFDTIGDVRGMLAQVETSEEVRLELIRLLEEAGL